MASANIKPALQDLEKLFQEVSTLSKDFFAASKVIARHTDKISSNKTGRNHDEDNLLSAAGAITSNRQIEKNLPRLRSVLIRYRLGLQSFHKLQSEEMNHKIEKDVLGHKRQNIRFKTKKPSANKSKSKAAKATEESAAKDTDDHMMDELDEDVGAIEESDKNGDAQVMDMTDEDLID